MEPSSAHPSTSSGTVVAEHVTKTFPESYGFLFWLRHRGAPPRRSALRDVSLSVRQGELFGLLGPNGAGKTTLLKTLATLTLPDAGRVLIAGIDATAQPEKARARIGLCTSEDRSFYFRLTGRENLRFFGTLSGLRGASLERRIDEVVRQVDLDADLDRRFSAYSSGMRQRLAIARALLANPDILFFDEPTRAVDPSHAESIRRFIRDDLVLRQGKTVILATNILEEAWRLCDRITILNRGTIVATGPPDSLGSPAVNGLQRYLVTMDRVSDGLLARTRALPGVVRVEAKQHCSGVTLEVDLELVASSLNELMRTVSANGAVVFSFETERPRPVDIFADLTRDPDDDSVSADVE